MGIEYGPSGHDISVERMELPYEDAVLEAAVLDPETSRAMHAEDPVLWVRSAIGVDTGRGASYVTNRELAEAHSEGGFAEWDPRAAAAVADYLHNKGFIGLRRAAQEVGEDAISQDQRREAVAGWVAMLVSKELN
ncbi:MAG TPA: hypothetical protein VF401_01420 [Candidatus Saccharimonadales bacterium]